MSGSIWEYRPASHKTEHHDKSRVVMVGPEGQRVLGGFLRSDLSAYLFSPDPEGARPYRSDSYINAIRRGCEVAFAMPYRLRHPDNFLLQQAADYLDMTAEQRGDLRKRLLTEARKWRREHCWSPGRLRHNFATRARRHAGIEAARVTLGHASAAVTEVYAERDLDVARAVVAKIG